MLTEKIITYGMLYFIWFLLIAGFVLSVISKQWPIAFMAVVTLLLTLIPLFIQKRYKIYISHFWTSFIAFFLYASIFLGEVNRFYDKFWWWDLLLHLISAIGFGLFGIIILLFVFGKNKNRRNAVLFSFFSFCFAVTIGVIWEILEFSLDSTFGFNMQKSGLLDTMSDLIIDCIGAGIASVIGFLYLTETYSNFFSNIIERTYRINKAINRRKRDQDKIE